MGEEAQPRSEGLGLNPRWTLRLRNDRYCAGWGVKLYLLIHPSGPIGQGIR